MTFTAEALIKALTVAPDHEAAFRAAARSLHRDPGLNADLVVMISLRNRVAVALGVGGWTWARVADTLGSTLFAEVAPGCRWP